MSYRKLAAAAKTAGATTQTPYSTRFAGPAGPPRAKRNMQGSKCVRLPMAQISRNTQITAEAEAWVPRQPGATASPPWAAMAKGQLSLGMASHHKGKRARAWVA